MIDVQTIASKAGGEFRNGKALIPGPGHSKKDRSLSITTGDRGQLLWHSFAQDAWPQVQAYLASLGIDTGSRIPESEDAKRVRREREEALNADRFRKRTVAEDLWAQAGPLQGSIARHYLNEVRGVGLPPGAKLRFLQDAPFTPYHPDERSFPALVGAISNAAGALIGVHLTFLAPDGSGKADLSPSRKVIGAQKGGMIVLGKLSEMVVIAEGIESALSAAAVSGLPAIAAISAGNMAALELPPTVRAAMIAFDRDASGVGVNAARTLAKRLEANGLDVVPLPPPASFSDWNDATRGVSP